MSDHVEIKPIPTLCETSKLKSWVVVLSASFFFFYEFVQMNMFNAISSELMHAFNVNAESLGFMSSFYFLANVIFLFPAGMLLDRCATKKVILVSMSVCVLGTALLGATSSFYTAVLCRFLTGIGSAFCFLSVIRLASRWFANSSMAFVIGVVVTIAMLGGMVAQTPMTLLVDKFGWREALFVDAIFGLIIILVILVLVKDYPANHHQKHIQDKEAVANIGYFKSMRMAYCRLHNWLGGIYTCMMNLPVGLLGGLWGAIYLTSADKLTKIQATQASSMLFLGTIIGAPLVGMLSDKIKKRRPPMIAGALLSLILVIVTLELHGLGYYQILFLFLLLGITTSTQIIGYPLVAENSPRIITAMSVSVVNISIEGGSGILQPFFGYLMDETQLHRLHHISTHFAAQDFKYAMWIFPVGFLIAVFCMKFIPETNCNQYSES